MAPLRLGYQPAEHLHRVDVILAKLLGQSYQRGGGARLGKAVSDS
jgi:hypothetical protein